MPAEFRIDPARRCVYTRGWGVLTFADCEGHMLRLLADKAFEPSYAQLADFREVTEVPITHSEIYQLAARKVFAPDSRRAFVTRTPVQYGLCRMFQTYRSAYAEVGLQVFSDMDEALKWLEKEDAEEAAG